MRPLEGIAVLDFSTLLPGPLASLLLAEAGADVLKIERPSVGDDMRGYTPAWGDSSATFALLNRGKRSLAIDLKNPDAIETLHRLVKKVDIVIEQFRPGVMDRLGLGYEALAAINPRLIYCSISGYGNMGPKRDVAAHDLNLYAESGLLTASNTAASEAVMPATPIADIAGGSYPAVINILLALRERDSSGRGRHLDIALSDNLFPFTYWALAEGWGSGRFPQNRDHLVTGASPRYRLYATSDGVVVAAAPLEPKFWHGFCELIGLDEGLRDDSKDPAATAAAVAAIIRRDDAATWRARFAKVDCCCTVSRDLETAVDDVHNHARGLFDHQVVNEGGRTIPALPIPIDPAFRSPPIPIAVPSLGGANQEMLRAAAGPEEADVQAETRI